MPVGAVLVHTQQVIGEGGTAYWSPDPCACRNRWRASPETVWLQNYRLLLIPRCITTLEPCVMCSKRDEFLQPDYAGFRGGIGKTGAARFL